MNSRSLSWVRSAQCTCKSNVLKASIYCGYSSLVAFIVSIFSKMSSLPLPEGVNRDAGIPGDAVSALATLVDPHIDVTGDDEVIVVSDGEVIVVSDGEVVEASDGEVVEASDDNHCVLVVPAGPLPVVVSSSSDDEDPPVGGCGGSAPASALLEVNIRMSGIQNGTGTWGNQYCWISSVVLLIIHSFGWIINMYNKPGSFPIQTIFFNLRAALTTGAPSVSPTATPAFQELQAYLSEASAKPVAGEPKAPLSDGTGGSAEDLLVFLLFQLGECRPVININTGGGVCQKSELDFAISRCSELTSTNFVTTYQGANLCSVKSFIDPRNPAEGYRLRGFISHDGAHYTVHLDDRSSDKWILYDDAIVQEVKSLKPQMGQNVRDLVYTAAYSKYLKKRRRVRGGAKAPSKRGGASGSSAPR